jgi:hypothetical protein
VGALRPLVLDAGALIAFERGDRRVRGLLSEARRLVIPAGALAQVFRDRKRQVTLRALCNSRKTEIAPLDRAAAEAAGELCGRARTRDVVDASVVLVARLEHGVVATSDPDDLRRLDPSLPVVKV